MPKNEDLIEEDEGEEEDEYAHYLRELEGLTDPAEVLDKVDELFHLEDGPSGEEIWFSASRALRKSHPEISAQFLIAAMQEFI